MNDERLNKLLGLIKTLPADQIVIIAEKCQGLGEISPKVQKLISIFEKLSDEEKEQFFRNVTPCDGHNPADSELHEPETIDSGSEGQPDCSEPTE